MAWLYFSAIGANAWEDTSVPGILPYSATADLRALRVSVTFCANAFCKSTSSSINKASNSARASLN